MPKNIIIQDIEHQIGQPLPSSLSVFFQCTRCWTILCSKPIDNVYCKCGNLSIDVDYGRAGARDEKLLRVLRIV
jgi:hypothetical protein